MERLVIDDIPFVIDKSLLVNALRLTNIPHAAVEVSEFAQTAMRIGRPKVLYKPVQVESCGEDNDKLRMDGVVFHSSLLKTNLAKSDFVLAYLCTCGAELEQWSHTFTNVMHKYWADMIQSFALGCALNALNTHIEQRYHLQDLSSMNPGSLDNWPIQEQKNVFRLLGDGTNAIGVILTKALIMKPIKSLSGILFSSDEAFINCQRCPRQKCPGRRAPYNNESGGVDSPHGCNAVSK